MLTFFKFVAVCIGLFTLIVIAFSSVAFAAQKFTFAAKEVIDYYLKKKKEVIAEMEEEFAEVAAKKDFGSH
jgi:hypothetical protein